MIKKPLKETKTLQLTFDMNDEKQRNCYELISLISRKKSRFISNLVDEFLKNHPNAKEKKTLAFFVEHYDELKNLSGPPSIQALVMQSGSSQNNGESINYEETTKSETAAMGAFTA